MKKSNLIDMRRVLHIAAFVLLLSLFSCAREPFAPSGDDLPEGVPALVTIPFGAEAMTEVSVGTKADAGLVNESHVHDIYVLLFDKGDLGTGSPRKIYGRYFNFEHRRSTLAELNSRNNECWYVENKDLEGGITRTRGAVKISTVTCSDVVVVLLANVDNAVTELDDEDQIGRLNAIADLDELRSLSVTLTQDVVNRKNLFLMMGTLGYDDNRTISTGSMHWNKPVTSDTEYDPDYRVVLRTVNAKVKFRIKTNPLYVSDVTPVYWKVCSTPNSSYLFSDYNDGRAPDDTRYFDTQEYYFEGTDTDPATGETFYSFCFYMLENKLSPTRAATKYYQRELRNKLDSGESGYVGPDSPEYGDHYVDNGDWTYANPNSTYVQFNLVLTLTEAGIANLGSDDPSGMSIGQAMTSNTVFTVHLGDFVSSGKPDMSDEFNDYNTERGTFYTYTVTVNNTRSIYTEVVLDDEVQAGQEGFLLLTDAEIISLDSHYEYRTLEFPYRPDIRQDLFSWYVKTPFSIGGPTVTEDPSNPGNYVYDVGKLDYLWVKFSVNEVLSGTYTEKRSAYPGDSHYHPEWEPGQTVNDRDGLGDKEVPDLMDITQLIKYIFAETAKQKASGSSAFISDDGSSTPVIRVTAFVDEYYYEKDPLTGQVDPDLWRKFVNANAREMHILSDAQHSRDRQSDVILSSHSIVQESIQTIYNIYASDLHTLWGAERVDEMRKLGGGWPYWPYAQGDGSGTGGRAGSYNTELGKENGRLNSAYIWDFYSSQNANGTERTDRRWDTFFDYHVTNEVPELREEYYGMAYSCLTRNRDNNGNGFVDRDEVRWYLAASNQLIGMWVGNEALNLDTRLYRPAENQWRAHIMSSTDKRVCWSEEGAGATPYSWDYSWSSNYVWHSIEEASLGESVRCVRNIGTYSDGGALKDISYAPYSLLTDQYFTLTANADDSYTFHFDRLNPKSLRDLSEGDLPYENQFNVANRVYLEMTTQPLAENVGETPEDAFSKNLKALNDDITALGTNPYCPPGYRFPNQTEMALMSMYLPYSYFETDKYGQPYEANYYMPTRTYYDRGVIGGVTAGMNDEEIAIESTKIGWGYSMTDNRSHCMRNANITRSRCVRDVDLTGFIDGGLTMPTSVLSPTDQQTVTFSFFSTASAFVYASLKLCYTDRSGNYHERDIPVQRTPSGLQYQAEQLVEIPSLSEFGLVVSDLDTDLKNMKFKVEMRNAAGTSKTFETPFVLGSRLSGCSISFPQQTGTAQKGAPLKIDIGTRNDRSKLESVVLHWKAAGDADFQELPLVTPGTVSAYHGLLYTDEIIGAAWETEANRYKEYLYYVTAECDDETTYVSETVSQQFVRLGYTPNPVPTGGWTNNNQCNVTWRNDVTGLNFDRGDFIEADMDLSNCVYVYLTGNEANDMGKDCLIGFSTNNVGTINNTIMWYYPSVQNLVPPPGDTGWMRMRVHAGRWLAKEYTGVLTSLNLILDKDGILRDGIRYTDNPGDWNSRVKAALTSSSSIQLGSTEGSHHSRATYNYIRVVRYKDNAVTPIPRP